VVDKMKEKIKTFLNKIKQHPIISFIVGGLVLLVFFLVSRGKSSQVTYSTGGDEEEGEGNESELTPIPSSNTITTLEKDNTQYNTELFSTLNRLSIPKKNKGNKTSETLKNLANTILPAYLMGGITTGFEGGLQGATTRGLDYFKQNPDVANQVYGGVNYPAFPSVPDIPVYKDL
jgi:hypothetical protein